MRRVGTGQILPVGVEEAAEGNGWVPAVWALRMSGWIFGDYSPCACIWVLARLCAGWTARETGAVGWAHRAVPCTWGFVRLGVMIWILDTLRVRQGISIRRELSETGRADPPACLSLLNTRSSCSRIICLARSWMCDMRLDVRL